MKYLTKLLILLIILALSSCSKNEKEISLIKKMNQEDEMIQAYKEGIKAIEKNDSFFAAKKFLEAELLYPQSEWASKAALMASYSYYIEDYYSEAIRPGKEGIINVAFSKQMKRPENILL